MLEPFVEWQSWLREITALLRSPRENFDPIDSIGVPCYSNTITLQSDDDSFLRLNLLVVTSDYDSRCGDSCANCC